ncbi:leukocyte-specific transcript 1 protein isoform X2 [Hemicordylus capensis]|nr:leukocyte-specific transcript 1 protein isoform X2 [Hemicordylus capensis]
MGNNNCGCCSDKYYKAECYSFPNWALWTVGGIAFLLLVTSLILSICLCRTCKRTKKRRFSEDDNPEEVNLHYAELQNLPATSRGQCDGGTSSSPPPIVQNSDYATVAELMENTGEKNCCQEQKEDNEETDGVREGQSSVGEE